MFGFIGDVFEDIVSAPWEMGEKLLSGDIDGFFTHLVEMSFELDIFFGYDIGDIASELDDFLDQNPWLKGVIVAAGFAAGGVGGLVAAAAIAATDTMSEINEGTFDLGDIGSGAMEFGALYAGGALGAGAGNAMLSTTAGQIQAGTQILGRSGLLGDAGKYVAIAGGAAAGNFSVQEIAKTAAKAMQETGLLGDDGNAVMDAVISASTGDYSSLQAGVSSGIQALRQSQLLGRDAEPYLGAATDLMGSDDWSTKGSISNVSSALARTGVLGDDGSKVANLVNTGVNTDINNNRDLVRTGSEVFRQINDL